jgi:alpha-amylase
VIVALLALACSSPDPYAADPDITSEVEDWRDEVIYQVLVDRFANGDVNNDYNVTRDDTNLARYMGGDYQGIIDNVDYFKALGVTTLWISPVVVNVEEDAGGASYHGYWTQDFLNVNPHFGDLPKLRELVDVMHQNDIKVVLDIVVNHVGQLFYYDINRNGQPDITTYYATDGSDTVDIVTEWDPAYDGRGVQGYTSLGESGAAPLGWVDMPEINRVLPNPPEFANDAWYNRRGRVTDWGNFEQVVYGDFPGGLKDLRTELPEVREALIDAYAYWIEAANLDGFRIDTLKHVEHGFWQTFCPAIRDRCALFGKERFLMFGESFDGDDALIGSYTFDEEVDSVVYFSQKYQVYDDVFKYGQPTTRIETLYNARDTNFGTVPHTRGVGQAPRDVLVNFIDNHDIPRFLYDKDSIPALKSALTYLLTQDGIPCIYYGTEQGFSGGNDPANREPLWWSGYDTQGDLFTHIAALTQLRKEVTPLRRGDFTLRWTTNRTGSEEDAGIVAFERSHDGESVLVVVNTHDDQTSHTSYGGSDMPVSFAPGTLLREVFPPGSARTFTVASDRTVRVDVGPRDGVVLVP